MYLQDEEETMLRKAVVESARTYRMPTLVELTPLR